MRPIQSRLVFALSLVALAACADPSAPVQRPGDQVALPSLAANTGASQYVASGQMLHRTKWASYDITDSATITPDRGGQLIVRSAGLKVTFPKYAVSVPTVVWVTAYAGNKVVYEFGPHGTQFLAPVTIEQDLKDTKAYGSQPLAQDLFGGYVPDGTDDIDANDNVKVSETFDVTLIPDTQRKSRWAQFSTWHFSGYVLASGRRDY